MSWRRRTILSYAAFCAADLFGMPVLAQQRDSMPTIGLLQLSTAAASTDWIEAVRKGLALHGLIDGKTVRVLIRHADNDTQRLVGLARQLAALGCRVIVTQGTTSVAAAHLGAPEVPIVMAPSADPVGAGFANSLARPGGKITGLSIIGGDVIRKRVEILKSALPAARSFAAMLQAANPSNGRWRVALEEVGQVLGLQIHVREIASPDDIVAAFDWAAGLKVDGVFLNADPMFDANISTIVRMTFAHRLPAISGGSGAMARAGMLMSFATELDGFLSRAGYYVAEILRGVDPGTLPIEQPTIFRLVVNLKTARALGLGIPPLLLARADEVIE